MVVSWLLYKVTPMQNYSLSGIDIDIIHNDNFAKHTALTDRTNITIMVWIKDHSGHFKFSSYCSSIMKCEINSNILWLKAMQKNILVFCVKQYFLTNLKLWLVIKNQYVNFMKIRKNYFMDQSNWIASHGPYSFNLNRDLNREPWFGSQFVVC